MKRLVCFALVVVLLPGLLLAQDGRHDRQKHGHYHPRHVQDRYNARVSGQFAKLGIHGYPKTYGRNRLLVAGVNCSMIDFPGRGPGGIALHANLIARDNFSHNPLVRTQMSIVMRAPFRNQIRLWNRNEHRVGFYYWHDENGFRFCHYYDRWGYHWYGWYLGNAFFWTRWYANHWWWYDPAYYRWCYWYDGGWWWQNPDTTAIYVYDNGNYIPLDNNENVNNSNESSQPPMASTGPQRSFYSLDGSREVKLVGSDAFLYDSSGNNSFKPIYLSSNVSGVRFSNPQNGQPLQIMLTLNDGSFALFDGHGNSLSGGNDDQGDNPSPPSNMNPPNDGNGGGPPAGEPSNPPSMPPTSGN